VTPDVTLVFVCYTAHTDSLHSAVLKQNKLRWPDWLLMPCMSAGLA